MSRLLGRIVVALMLVIGWSGSATADWKLDIGYTALQAELGSAMPTGAGVKVTQVEASGGKPDPGNAAFAGDTFTLKTSGLTVRPRHVRRPVLLWRRHLHCSRDYQHRLL